METIQTKAAPGRGAASKTTCEANYTLCSGIGQYHTAEPGKDNRKPYLQITRDEILRLVDEPPTTDKSQTQWLIASSLLSRTFKTQEESGVYWLLWADLDKEPKPLSVVAEKLLAIVGDVDFEIYTTSSARHDFQKARILVWLKSPLRFADWTDFQHVLNDRLEAAGIMPDRATERAAQLCYLANRGAFYDKISIRNVEFFDPENAAWRRAVTDYRKELGDRTEALRRETEGRQERRAAGKIIGESIITAFNNAYTVQDILLKVGYAQRGDTFRHPQSESGSFSACVKNGRVHALSPNDPLYSEGKGAHDAFSAFAVLFAGGDQGEATRIAGDAWLTIGGLSWNKFKQREFMRGKEPTAEPIDLLDDKQRATEPPIEEPDEEPPFKRVSLDDVLTNPPEPQRYVWGERIPFEVLSLLAAHGGTGKSLFAMQLAAHTATGKSFLGLPTEQIKTLFFSAEDSTDTIRRRMGGICQNDDLNPVEIARNLIILDATDAPCLFHEVNLAGVRTAEPTANYHELADLIEKEQIRFLIVDNASDSFGANPIDRHAVTKFIRALVRLVRDAGGAVLLLSHVNKNTSKNGAKQTDTEGYADSAAWHNATRSRLFLNATEEGTLALHHQKINYGKRQPVLNMVFREDGSSLCAANAVDYDDIDMTELDANIAKKKRAAAREPLLRLIHEFYKRGESISPSPNSHQTHAHALLGAETTYPFDQKKIGKTECMTCLRDLQREGFLQIEQYMAKNRHVAERWVLTEKGLEFIGKPIS